jgi:diadenosine tetraphosphate (Ap4A) HIT family hydrolase
MRLPEPSGLPLILILESRDHHDELGELPDAMAAQLGLLISRVDRAMCAVPGVGRVHSCRWGDGSEHLHWWFLARPARLPQLLGSFAAIWDDVLPPTPVGVWDANTAAFLEAFRPPQAAG